MSRFCKWFGHQKPVERRGGWYSPGEEYVRCKVRSGGVDGIQRIHGLVYDKCERCGEEYLLCRIHIPDWAMKSSYEIIKYQMGRLGDRLAEEVKDG